MSRRPRVVIAAGALALSALSCGPIAAAPLELSWADLIPAGSGQSPTSLQGLVQHDQVAPGTPESTPTWPRALLPGRAPAASRPAQTAAAPAASAPIRSDLDGKEITMLGYLLPLGFEGTGVREFLLVPYVGACIHVPPPPANQLVLVRAKGALQVKGLFDAIRVTGRMTARAAATSVADVGYQINDAQVKFVEYE